MLETSIDYTKTLFDSTDTFKHKVVFITGFLKYKHLGPGEEDEVTSEFLQELDRGGLRVPILDTTCFVYIATPRKTF